MLNPKDLFTGLQKKAEQLSQQLPPIDALKQQLQSLVQQNLARMNLVTREEFDVQKAVLQRTREKLEQLEKQVSELEKSSANR